jgi:hypothetical protein
VRKSVVRAGPVFAPAPETVDGGEGKYGVVEVGTCDFLGCVADAVALG